MYIYIYKVVHASVVELCSYTDKTIVVSPDDSKADRDFLSSFVRGKRL